MPTRNIWQDRRALHLGLTLACGLALLLGLLLAIGAARPPEVALAHGSIIRHVDCTNGSDSGDCTVSPCRAIGYALSRADDGDTIKVAACTYTESLTLNEPVSLMGDGADDTIIRALSGQRVMIIAGATITNSTVISGFTITGGDTSGRGGGIAVYHSSPMLSHNTITNNHATGYGGGVYVIGSAALPTLSSNQIISNTTADDGGGVFIDDYSSPTLIGNTIAGNYAPSNGGGVYVDFHAIPTLISNTIARNTGVWGSGGIMLYNHVTPTLIGNIIISNTSYEDGGGLSIYNSSPILSGNWISGNIAEIGGGICMAGSSPVLDGNLVSGNTAKRGGGIYMRDSSPVLLNDVVANNQAQRGSGLYIYSSWPRLLHTTIARNGSTVLTAGGGGLYVVDYRDNYCTVALTNTILVSHTVGITVTAGNTATLNGVLWYSNTINFGGGGSIAVTNAYTGTPAFDADGYHLTGASAAIDNGANAGVDYDIDGDPRPQGSGYDLGADEFAYHGIYLPLVLKNR
jgi:parallel beta-helix repeat protein